MLARAALTRGRRASRDKPAAGRPSPTGVKRQSSEIMRLELEPGGREVMSDSAEEDVVSNAPASAVRRVLLVEDNRDVARALSRLIQLLGHELRVAYDGEEALEAVNAFEPEVVFMDISLPKLNGYDAARAIRKRPSGQAIFLIAVTGWSRADDHQRAIDAGFDAHVIKPVELDTLREYLAMPGKLEGK